jgi:Mannosyltransferase (PIG-V)
MRSGLDTPLPGWARATDMVAALMTIVASTIAVSGGVRAQVWNHRVNLTSPVRLLLWAAALVIVRHAIARQHPMYRHLAVQVAAWARSIPLRTAALVTIGTRPAIFAIGYLAVVLFGYAPGAVPFHDFEGELLNLPLRWDAGWYLGIATHGYEYLASAGASAQQNIVFFPAFPMLVRMIGRLGGNTTTAYVVGGTLASVALFALALAYLYQLAREELSDEQAATALWMIAAYPFAVFFGAIYTESLFLLATAGAFFHFRRGELAGAAAWGLVLGLTRPNGFLVTVPLAILAFTSGGRHRAWLAAAAPAAGTAIYSAFIWRIAGHPFAWALGHAAWGRHYDGLTKLVVDRYGYVANAGLLQYVSREPYDFLNAIPVLFVLAAMWPVARRFGPAYAAFLIVCMVPPLAAGGLMSAGRFSAVLFPVFFWLAAVVPPRHRAGWIASFAAMQAINAALFYTWRPLY